jgi:hypothetical protein
VNKYKTKNINFIDIMSLSVTTVASLCSLSVSITLLFVSGEFKSVLSRVLGQDRRFIQARRTPTCCIRAMKDFIELYTCYEGLHRGFLRACIYWRSPFLLTLSPEDRPIAFWEGERQLKTG